MSAYDPQYLFDPDEKPILPLVSVPLIVADDASMDGYGYLVEEPDRCEIEIVRWPAQGWRSIDEGTGDEGGITEGTFSCRWWHEGVFPVEGEQRFFSRQGKVHARVSCDFEREFGVYLSVPLSR